MRLIVREGPNGTDADGVMQPTGRQVWFGEVEDLTVSALRGTGADVEPGEWYAMSSFSDMIALIDPARIEEALVYTTVKTKQSGVEGSWESTIGVAELVAALMLCRSVIDYAQHLKGYSELWLRIE